MNKIQVLGGGFPGTSKTWRFIRDMINEVHDLATAMGGENCIVKGCETVNGVVADGIVIINGEALPFQGGALGQNIEVVEDVESVQYFNDADGDGQAEMNEAYFERYARFGAAGTAWDSLKRISPLSEVSKRLPPRQSALPFWGNIGDIPSGWQLCDGTNGTPDLQGMFVAGYDPDDADHNAPGKQGGASKVSLTAEQNGPHFHKGSTTYDGRHSHTYQKSVEGRGYETRADDNPHSTYESAETSTHFGHSHGLTTTTEGKGEAHENRPKYYTMAWIAFVG